VGSSFESVCLSVCLSKSKDPNVFRTSAADTTITKLATVIVKSIAYTFNIGSKVKVIASYSAETFQLKEIEWPQ